MNASLPPDDDQPSSPHRNNQQRLLAYGLLAAGALLTFFNANLSQWLGLGTSLLQIVALALLAGGAILFYNVRETSNRLNTYREAFKPLSEPEQDRDHTSEISDQEAETRD